MEGRGVAKGNAKESPAGQTPSPETALTGLQRVRETEFTVLHHHITPKRPFEPGPLFSERDFPAHFQLISFGYTFCPDICPTTLAEMAVVMDKLGEQAERLQPMFITVDPERDTAAVLHTYTAFFHPRILGLSGSPALVRRAADNFKVRYEKVREPGTPADQYAVDHSAGMYLLVPDGGYIRKFAYGTDPSEIADRVREIISSDARRLPPVGRRYGRD